MTSSPGPPVDGRAARWAGQRERRRRDFVDAALRAIAEHGRETSIEQIADAAGVSRPQLYKHFADTTDLQGAIADHAVEQITAELAPLWQLRGTAMQMISTAVGSHTAWLAEHHNLYRYLSRIAQSSGATRDAITDIKTAVANHLARLLEHYLTLFNVDTRMTEPVAYGVVGLVDSATAQWLDNPRGLPHGDFSALLARWVWLIFDDILRVNGFELDPHIPLDFPNFAFPPEKEPKQT